MVQTAPREDRVKDPNPHGVRVGQVWEDNDYRSRGRKLMVMRVEVDPAGREPYAEVTDTAGRRRYIKLRRFRPNSTGYMLVADSTERLAP